MDKKQKEDYLKKFLQRDTHSPYIMVNGRTITVEEYRSKPTYYNNLPIDGEYLKRVKGDYDSNN